MWGCAPSLAWQRRLINLASVFASAPARRRGPTRRRTTASLVLGWTPATALAHAADIGQGMRRDRARALRLWKRAAELGDPTATCNVGIYYRQRGEVGLALRWFHKAAALGDAGAELEIAKAMVFGRLTAAEQRAVRQRVVRAQSDRRLSQQERDDARAFVACIDADGYQRPARRR